MQGYSLPDATPFVESGQDAGGERGETKAADTTSAITGSLGDTRWGDQQVIVVWFSDVEDAGIVQGFACA